MTIYATPGDLEVRLGRALRPEEDLRADALLTDASALVEGFVRSRGVAVDPAVARAIVCQVVLRMYETPAGTTQESVGGVSRSYGTNGTDMLSLLPSEKSVLLGLTARLRSVPLRHMHERDAVLMSTGLPGESEAVDAP